MTIKQQETKEFINLIEQIAEYISLVYFDSNFKYQIIWSEIDNLTAMRSPNVYTTNKTYTLEFAPDYKNLFLSNDKKMKAMLDYVKSLLLEEKDYKKAVYIWAVCHEFGHLHSQYYNQFNGYPKSKSSAYRSFINSTIMNLQDSKDALYRFLPEEAYADAFAMCIIADVLSYFELGIKETDINDITKLDNKDIDKYIDTLCSMRLSDLMCKTILTSSQKRKLKSKSVSLRLASVYAIANIGCYTDEQIKILDMIFQLMSIKLVTSVPCNTIPGVVSIFYTHFETFIPNSLKDELGYDKIIFYAMMPEIIINMKEVLNGLLHPTENEENDDEKFKSHASVFK